MIGSAARTIVLAFSLAGFPLVSQVTTTLQPRTVEEFQKYADTVEHQLQERWSGERPFLAIDEDSENKAKVLEGELLVHPGSPKNPLSVPSGLIHDWVGDVFIPRTTMSEVLPILQDYGRHHEIYPEIVQSRLLSRNGNDLIGYWRLERKRPLLTVDLDVRQEAHYKEIAPGKWICRAYAKDISEMDNPGTRLEKKYTPGHGTGFLWRLYAYWSLQAIDGGVLAENRSLSLSRDIPLAIAWMVKPFVQDVPRESLDSTLKNTRRVATK